MSDTDHRAPVLQLRDATLGFGNRLLWHGLSLDVRPGEFVAILGPNGTGKTSLLKVLLGQHQLTSGAAKINGHPVRRGNPDLGYIPQQKGLDAHTPMRGRDMVRMGIQGHKWGFGLPNKKLGAKVDRLLRAVDAQSFANAPAGTLSGGEQQRVRIASALGSDPKVLLCDEPLLSLDQYHQKSVAALLDQQRRESGAAVMFVTHEINPILPYVDRVLYLAGGRFRIGTPEEVINSETLTRLYGSPVTVARINGQLVIVGGEDEDAHHATTRPKRGAV